ncbi:hypothetical protein [Paenibacillus polymyxa]|jgi:hypothetical protein|uniref:hypothetical protein n=1 Tax=Paenibacillus polymyxa TaxID=1406 RepID=UPI00083D3E6C|nr:hypothetical protein [Paenibacillus polymyxa]ODB61378.1 hypothetical protein A7309_15135 [Paenibacillus polymyxa]
MKNSKEPHLYWQKHIKLIRKFITTVPKNSHITKRVTATNRENKQNRVRDIFWECSKKSTLRIAEKSPVFYEAGSGNPPIPLTMEWDVTFYNDSAENIDITVYAFEEDNIGFVYTEV